MKVAILGFGREGRSLLKFLQKRGQTRNDKDEIWVLDKNPRIPVPRGVTRKLGKGYLRDLQQFDIIFRSPGVPFSPELLRAHKDDATEISSATKLFMDEAARRGARVIGVTGTKGKGTTSTLIYEIIKASGKRVFLGGNIGTPPLDFAHQLRRGDLVVLELSSFQLLDMQRSPYLAVALMVTSEHLDWHKNVREYLLAKANIVRFQSPKDFAVLAEDYPRSAAYARIARSKIFTFSKHAAVTRGAYVKNNAFWFAKGGKGRGKLVCSTDELQIKGLHNWDNTLAALTVAKLLKIKNETIARAIRNFKGLGHRLHYVRTVRSVRYYDDSYSTTPETALVALQAFTAPKVVILGGSGKGSDFKELGKAISKSETVKAIIGIGKEWPRIKKHITNPRIELIEGLTDMKALVRAAADAAAPGDVVLLSPGCASFGMFKNYTDRGDQFKREVRELTK